MSIDSLGPVPPVANMQQLAPCIAGDKPLSHDKLNVAVSDVEREISADLEQYAPSIVNHSSASDLPASKPNSIDLPSLDQIFEHNNTSQFRNRGQAQAGRMSSSPGDTSTAYSSTPESSSLAWGNSNSLGPRRRNREIACKDWKEAKIKIENLLRPAVLRYGKLDNQTFHGILYEVLGAETDTSSAFFRKGLAKMKSNVATWKCKTLSEMEVSSLYTFAYDL
jgi:hypothetical protein